MIALKHNLPARLITERLVLVAPDRSHIPRIAALANNERIHRVMSRLPFPYREEDAHVFVTEIATSPHEACFAIEHDGACIGIVGLRLDEGELPELGYWLGEPYWGQGFATEAGRAVIAAAKAAGATALRSRALLGNSASRHVLKKLGFTEIGEDTDKTGTLAGQTVMLMRLELCHDRA